MQIVLLLQFCNLAFITFSTQREQAVGNGLKLKGSNIFRCQGMVIIDIFTLKSHKMYVNVALKISNASCVDGIYEEMRIFSNALSSSRATPD